MEQADSPGAVIGAGWLLALAALLGAGLLALVDRHAAPLVAENQRVQRLRALSQVMPEARYDNDLLKDAVEVVDRALSGSDRPVTVYRATRSGVPTAVVLTVVAADGYGGPITLLVGVDSDGRVVAVRVVSHRETPGLGDAIEARRSDWIDGFANTSLHHPSGPGWGVKRDGGEFDQFTGATITPRAVVAAVHRALHWFERHRSQLFAVPPDAVLKTGDTNEADPDR